MFFVARGHRLTSSQWRYQGKAVEFSNRDGVKARLRQLGDQWAERLESGGHLSAGEVLYGCIKYTKGFRDAPEFMECAVRFRPSDGVVRTLAFGNCLTRVTSGQGLVGYVSILANGLAVGGKCSFQPHQTSLSGNLVDGDFEWLMHRGATIREKASGRVSVRHGSNSIELDLKFPSIREEDSGRVVKVAVEKEGQLLGHAMRSFNPMFAKGYRVSLWARDEIPIFQAAAAINLSGELWNGILLAIFGIWFCYAPIKGEGSSG